MTIGFQTLQLVYKGEVNLTETNQLLKYEKKKNIKAWSMLHTKPDIDTIQVRRLF